MIKVIHTNQKIECPPPTFQSSVGKLVSALGKYYIIVRSNDRYVAVHLTDGGQPCVGSLYTGDQLLSEYFGLGVVEVLDFTIVIGEAK